MTAQVFGPHGGQGCPTSLPLLTCAILPQVDCALTRPELPPGWNIYPSRDIREPEGFVLTRGGVCYRLGSDRAELVANAWRIWRGSNPEWAAYLAQLESEAS